MNKIIKIFLYVFGVMFPAFLILAGFFFFKHYQTQILVDALVNDALKFKKNLTDEGKALKISQRIFLETDNLINRADLDWYSRWEATGYFNMTTSVGLEYNCYGIDGEDGDGPCGTMTKIFLVTMWDQNIRARKLQLEAVNEHGGHTMAEFYYLGKWRVISPSDSSFVWRNHSGEIATVEEIRNDTSIFKQIFNHKSDWPYSFKETSNINWEKLPTLVVSVIRFFIGEEAYENAETPRLYEQPRRLLSLLFLALSILTFVIWFYLFRKSRKMHRVNKV
jgi:hypothetical protein